jgi:hypothetical protein
MVSLGLVVVICMAATAIWWKIVEAFETAGAALAPFTPFTAIWVICDPQVLFASEAELLDDLSLVRWLSFIGSVAAVGVIGLIVAAMYKAMVRNFDMTLRKQTASS